MKMICDVPDDIIESVRRGIWLGGNLVEKMVARGIPLRDSENQNKWIPIKWHNIMEEEREREGYPKDWLTILDCHMPNDDEEVLVTVKGKNGNLYVETDTCYFDGMCYSSDSGYDWIDDVIAWMPLPDPYVSESEEHDGQNKEIGH